MSVLNMCNYTVISADQLDKNTMLDFRRNVRHISYKLWGCENAPSTLQDIVITDETGKDGQSGIEYSYFIQAPHFTFKNGSEARHFLSKLLLRVPVPVRQYISRQSLQSRNIGMPIRFVSILYSSFLGELRSKHFSALSDFLGTIPEVPRNELFVYKYSFLPWLVLVFPVSNGNKGSSLAKPLLTTDITGSVDNNLPSHFDGIIKQKNVPCYPPSPSDAIVSVNTPPVYGNMEQKDFPAASDAKQNYVMMHAHASVIHSGTDSDRSDPSSGMECKDTIAITIERNPCKETISTDVARKQSYIGFIKGQISSLALSNPFSISLVPSPVIVEHAISHGDTSSSYGNQTNTDLGNMATFHKGHDTTRILLSLVQLELDKSETKIRPLLTINVLNTSPFLFSKKYEVLRCLLLTSLSTYKATYEVVQYSVLYNIMSNTPHDHQKFRPCLLNKSHFGYSWTRIRQKRKSCYNPPLTGGETNTTTKGIFAISLIINLYNVLCFTYFDKKNSRVGVRKNATSVKPQMLHRCWHVSTHFGQCPVFINKMKETSSAFSNKMCCSEVTRSVVLAS
ncbi:hypothetical protein C1646_671215 [Rhizophagus diaphanus]|nr:hypothetical protein C1646_671215 [Rhizophagus diaphanus] [Rhizophagus sp. MUCL 43196]